jgi:hypothetical protein
VWQVRLPWHKRCGLILCLLAILSVAMNTRSGAGSIIAPVTSRPVTNGAAATRSVSPTRAAPGTATASGSNLSTAPSPNSSAYYAAFFFLLQRHDHRFHAALDGRLCSADHRRVLRRDPPLLQYTYAYNTRGPRGVSQDAPGFPRRAIG